MVALLCSPGKSPRPVRLEELVLGGKRAGRWQLGGRIKVKDRNYFAH